MLQNRSNNRYTLTRDVVGCKSSNGFNVDESKCLDSGDRPSVLYQCDGCNSTTSGSTESPEITTTLPSTTTTYAPCPSNQTSTPLPDYGNDDDSNDSHSTSYVLATTLVVLVVISSGVLLVYGRRFVRDHSDSTGNTWIAVRGVDPDDDGLGDNVYDEEENEGEIEL